MSLSILGALIAGSCVTLPFARPWYNVQELNAAIRHPPAFSPVVSYEPFQRSVIKGLGQAGEFAASAAFRAVSWFGHDDLGRSLLFRLLPGFLLSLGMGLAAAAMAMGIGFTWGAIAGLVGGRTDLVMMRIVDVLYGLPYVLLVILLKIGLTRPLASLFGGHTRIGDMAVLLIAIGGVSWLTMARVIRGQVLSLKTQPFIEAARASGASSRRILVRHLLPNLVGTMLVYAMLVVPQAVMQESFLSFLGIGIQPPIPSLGRLAADGVQSINPFVGYWWLIVFPCGFLVVTLIALNFIGDALRERFDPRSQAENLVVR